MKELSKQELMNKAKQSYKRHLWHIRKLLKEGNKELIQQYGISLVYCRGYRDDPPYWLWSVTIRPERFRFYEGSKDDLWDIKYVCYVFDKPQIIQPTDNEYKILENLWNQFLKYFKKE